MVDHRVTDNRLQCEPSFPHGALFSFPMLRHVWTLWKCSCMLLHYTVPSCLDQRLLPWRQPLTLPPPGRHVTLSLPRCLACVWRTSLIRLHSRALCAPACEKLGPSSPHRWNFNFTPRSQSLPAMSCCCHSEELIFTKRQAGKGRG